MKRKVLFGGVVLAILGLPAAASAALLGLPLTTRSTSTAASPPRDFTTGGGITSIGTSMGYSAHQSPTGGATGHATFKNKEIDSIRQGPVVCITAVGKRAFFTIRNQQQATAPGALVSFVVEDNGEPTNGEPVDEIRQSNPPNPNCPPSRTALDPGLKLTRGNITVNDAG